ncbi:MAG TPA: rhodanese-like domain-containing protein [Geobacteraceae bacterium]|nr:rhodanese-like domain-containing protein [Geobacteraceae bacterium]
MKKIVILVVVAALLAVVSSALCAEKQAEPFTVVTSEEVKAMIDRQEPGLVVIDARSPGEYQEVHIKGAINIPWQMLENNPSALTLPLDAKLVFYCNGYKCGKSPKAARQAAKLGYRNLYVLSEGMPAWEEKGFAIYAGPDYEKKVETTRIPPRELKSLLTAKPGSITLVDVRDPQEFAEGHIPGAINIPANKFAALSGGLEKEKRIVAYCNSGGRSYNAYRKLQKMDFRNISQAIFADWQEAGLPVAKGPTH